MLYRRKQYISKLGSDILVLYQKNSETHFHSESEKSLSLNSNTKSESEKYGSGSSSSSSSLSSWYLLFSEKKKKSKCNCTKIIRFNFFFSLLETDYLILQDTAEVFKACNWQYFSGQNRQPN